MVLRRNGRALPGQQALHPDRRPSAGALAPPLPDDGAAVLGQAAHRSHHVVGRCRVQAGGRLIEKNELRGGDLQAGTYGTRGSIEVWGGSRCLSKTSRTGCMAEDADSLLGADSCCQLPARGTAPSLTSSLPMETRRFWPPEMPLQAEAGTRFAPSAQQHTPQGKAWQAGEPWH